MGTKVIFGTIFNISCHLNHFASQCSFVQTLSNALDYKSMSMPLWLFHLHREAEPTQANIETGRRRSTSVPRQTLKSKLMLSILFPSSVKIKPWKSMTRNCSGVWLRLMHSPVSRVSLATVDDPWKQQEPPQVSCHMGGRCLPIMPH